MMKYLNVNRMKYLHKSNWNFIYLKVNLHGRKINELERTAT